VLENAAHSNRTESFRAFRVQVPGLEFDVAGAMGGHKKSAPEWSALGREK
jgi:hypothetical protein